MAEDDEIKELIGRMSAAQRQGVHTTPAMIAVILSALRFHLAASAWLAKPRADPHDDAPRKAPEKYTGPPATIASLRRLGLVACTIECDGPDCWNAKRVTFDELRLDDSTSVPHIAQRRGFRCQRCGSGRVRLSPDWTDYAARGNGKSVQ